LLSLPKTELEPRGTAPFPITDAALLGREIERLGAKRILEFGPGDSTGCLNALGVHVTSCEHIDKWFEVAQERFAGHKRVRILKYTDTVPVVVHGIEDGETFDLAFVDSPKGFDPVRKQHPEYPECSRLNTVQYALKRAPVVLLHDGTREGEMNSLGHLLLQAHACQFILNSTMCRITRR
jgi:hypothetical protein